MDSLLKLLEKREHQIIQHEYNGTQSIVFGIAIEVYL